MSELWTEVRRFDDPDGLVAKFVFTKPNAVVESVLYRYPDYATRTVICCSIQSGCPIGCRFCGTGDAFVRSLSTEEIVSQPVHCINEALAAEQIEVADIERLQIMFMSMGEPLMNQDRLVEAIRQLHELYPGAALLVSTSAPDVDMTPLVEVSREIEQVGLQFSVHESTDEARDALIPFRRKMTLSQMAAAGIAWADATGRRPFFNYCVHAGNDSQADVDRLVALFDPTRWEATLSVICERDETMAAAHDRQESLTREFTAKMMAAGYGVRMFNPAGQDSIGGGCGQLWYVQDWYRDNPELARRNAGTGLKLVHAPGSVKKALAGHTAKVGGKEPVHAG